MDTAFITIVQKLVSEQGKEALLNAAKCKALLADYTRGEYKKERHLLLQALEAGVAKAIDSTQELEICKQQQSKHLQDEYSLGEQATLEVIDLLVVVLHGDYENERSKAAALARITRDSDARILLAKEKQVKQVTLEQQAPEKLPIASNTPEKPAHKEVVSVNQSNPVIPPSSGVKEKKIFDKRFSVLMIIHSLAIFLMSLGWDDILMTIILLVFADFSLLWLRAGFIWNFLICKILGGFFLLCMWGASICGLI